MMKPFMIQSKENGQRYLVLNYESDGDDKTATYLAAELISGELTHLSSWTIEKNFGFIEPVK